MPPPSLDDPVDAVPGVGARRATQLADAFGIRTVRDLLEHYPRRLDDRGALTAVRDAVVGQPATLVGTVTGWTQKQPGRRRPGRALKITEGRVRTDGGEEFLVTFFNQPWQATKLPVGTVAGFSGTVDTFARHVALKSPSVEVIGRDGPPPDRDPADLLDRDRLVPVYPATDALPSWRLGEWIGAVLDVLPDVADYLGAPLRQRHGVIELSSALRWVHRPPDRASWHAARRRLIFDELFTLQLGLAWRRSRLASQVAGVVNAPVGAGLADRFLAALPFAPTAAQTRSMTQIGEDLAAGRPMHRLLQGDVGAGKTVVAVWAMLCAVDNGRQAAMMAPTEVLAEQHLRTLVDLLTPLGVNMFDGVRVELLTSSTTLARRRRILGELLTGDVDLVVGTHALLEEGVRFADLGVVVIDEQHRFGVSQRVGLKDKRGALDDGTGRRRESMPDVLVMTATPIPRSLALTLYGDLDVSVLDELPPGRRPVVTQVIPKDSPRRASLYRFVRDQASAGFQTYVVCPLVEESDEVAATSVLAHHRHLADEVFPDLEVVLVHGQLPADDKAQAMRRLRDGDADVLVATTVIEVGVDVPRATVMVVEDAERFGISQLHQLRGRVGRGGDRSYCVLFADPASDEAQARLDAIAASTDGFELAEVDLELRGEGQLFGSRQSGLPDLKLARVQRDLELVGTTRDQARAVVADDPDLSAHAALRAEVLRRYSGGLDDFEALHTG
jgi:ATP-dependent DNA helicase RecG